MTIANFKNFILKKRYNFLEIILYMILMKAWEQSEPGILLAKTLKGHLIW